VFSGELLFGWLVVEQRPRFRIIEIRLVIAVSRFSSFPNRTRFAVYSV